MFVYKKTYEVIWADVDLNRHMRHTAYGDYAAHTRISFMADQGFGIDKLYDLGIAPVLIREELRYLKELTLGQKIDVTVKLRDLSPDGVEWKLLHEIVREDGKLAATIEITAVWIDVKARKKTAPPAGVREVFGRLERAQNGSGKN